MPVASDALMPMPLVLVLLSVFVGRLVAQQSWSTMVHGGEDTDQPRHSAVVEQRIAVAGDAVYVVWRTDDPIWPIQYVRSWDRGRSWSHPVALRMVSQASGFYASNLFVHADGGDAVVVGPSSGWPVGFIEVAASHDRGLTWTMQRFPGNASAESITAEGTTIVVGGSAGIVASTDMGRTWSASHAIAHAGSNSGPVEGPMHLRLAAGVLHAAWTERTGPARWDGYYNRSTNLGAQWQTVDRAITGPASSGGSIRVSRADGANVFLAWAEDTGTRFDRSVDGGATWLPNPVLLPIGANRYFEDLLFDGSNLLVLSHTPYPNFAVWGARSHDLGATWQAGTGPILAVSPHTRHPRITGTFGGGGLLAFSILGQNRQWLPWTYVVGMPVSTDGGVTWIGPSMQSLVFQPLIPSYVVDHGALFGAWIMNLGWGPPSTQVGAGWLAGPRSLGGALAGTLGTAPKLVMDRVPTLGFEHHLRLQDARAAAPAVVAFGPQRTPLPLLGGHLMLDPHAYSFVLVGGAAGSGLGDATMRFCVPQNSGLMEYACQAFVLDPAAAHGVAMSAGIEVRLL